jgi:MscS family membrane protein
MTESSNASAFMSACMKILEGSYGLSVQIIGILLFVLIFNWLVKSFLIRLSHSYRKQHKIWRLSFVSALYIPLSYVVWFMAFVIFLDMISTNFFRVHLFDIHLMMKIGIVLALGWFLLRWNISINHSMRELKAHHRIALTPGNLDMVSKLATIAIIIFTLFLLLDVTGSNIQTLIAFGGIGGLAIAFASQQVISNFFGGLMVYLNHPFTIGEYVNLPERKIEGEIEEIGWYMTCIRNPEKRPIYIPNSVFTQTIVLNISRKTHERIYLTFGLRYQDREVIKQVIDEIKWMLLKHPHIDHNQKVEVAVIHFESYSIDIEISAYVAEGHKADFKTIRQEIFIQMTSIIHKQGAELATPTTIVEIPTEIKLKH